MKKALVVALMAVVALVGCQKSSPEGGTVGKDKFTVKVPLTSTTVKQGEVVTLKVSVDRGSEFKQAVKLKVKAPKGLKVDPDSTTINPGDKGEVQLAITADKDAPLGDQKIMIEGMPDKGDTAETEFTVTVSAK